MTVLYKEFICDDIEKIELEKTLSNNEIKYQEKLREKYNPDNIFEDRKSNPKTEQIENENTSIAYKESFFSKLINKIKLIFSK